MLQYIIRRILLMIPTLLMISIISFIVIQLPPGDFLSTYIANLEMEGGAADTAMVEALRHRYGLDQPLALQYLKWMRNLLEGDWGQSLEWNRPVRELIGSRIMLTFVISLTTMLFGWSLAFPIGIYSAVRESYDGPLSMANDLMVWNITRDAVTERMAVSPDHAWDVAGPSEHLAPDPNRASEYTQFILDGRLDVDKANAHWMKEFMARTGLSAEDLGP